MFLESDFSLENPSTLRAGEDPEVKGLDIRIKSNQKRNWVFANEPLFEQ